LHELSLCQAIVDTVSMHADGRPLRRVNARIGYFRQVVPDSLQFAWQVITDGTDLASCELAVEHVPAVVVCRACGERTTLDLPLLLCASCAGDDVELVSGEEFQIASIDIVEEVG
jgi:hydrogenase nickel incorporation protein HypA/HybF